MRHLLVVRVVARTGEPVPALVAAPALLGAPDQVSGYIVLPVAWRIGELAGGVPLQHFLVSLKVVMRLPLGLHLVWGWRKKVEIFKYYYKLAYLCNHFIG